MVELADPSLIIDSALAGMLDRPLSSALRPLLSDITAPAPRAVGRHRDGRTRDEDAVANLPRRQTC